MTDKQAHKWVYLFEEGAGDNKSLLGGKGAGLCEMTRAGLPVPPGLIVTTEACNAFYANDKNFPDNMWEQVKSALQSVEEKVGKKFGDPKNPLLVSVRSGRIIRRGSSEKSRMASSRSSDSASTIRDRQPDLWSMAQVRSSGKVRFSGTYPWPESSAASTPE